MLRSLLCACALVAADALAAGVGLNVPSASSATEQAYFREQETVLDIDENAFKSESFWAEVDAAMPKGWAKDPKLERFRGFCNNLRTKPPGEDVFLENREQLLSQYVYPGLSEAGVHRSAYPAAAYPELAALKTALEETVAPAAEAELGAVLAAKPLTADEDADAAWDPLAAADEADDGEETWQKAAWFGWQYMSLRGARRWAPRTTEALLAVMRGLGPAHRFVGFVRQKAGVRGTVHSDGRNYMLSTLTPVVAPEGCGIVVDDDERAIVTGGEALILDNTFPHHVYNDAATDRFCLMAECWHPALAAEERDALATLFAVKDRFTVRELRMAPWGYAEADLAAAMSSGAIHDLDYWRRVDRDPAKKVKKPKKAKRAVGKKAAKKRAFG